MMTAKEAREAVMSKTHPIQADIRYNIEKAIERAVKNGELSSGRIDFSKCCRPVKEQILEEMKTLGYEVRYYNNDCFFVW